VLTGRIGRGFNPQCDEDGDEEEEEEEEEEEPLF
jgi:hypothetical protein